METYKTDLLDLRCCDNMQLMSQYADNHFELAVVDPPYGIGFSEFNRTNKTNTGKRIKANKYKQSNWDESIPNDEYFKELFRVSKNQIVWGGNYFSYIWQFGGKGFIFWKKNNPVDNFSDGELAWSSFNKVAKCFDYSYYGGIAGNTKADSKIHPTQKPVKLYDWIFKNYANDGDKILDTHLGSGSIAIASHYAGLHLTACEIDVDYFKESVSRIKRETAQQSLF